jgi:purine-binding chemotaxis protein CheW
MRERLSLAVGAEGQDHMNLIVTLADGAASIIVDSVGDVIEVDPNRYKPCPSTLATPLREMITGVYQMQPDRGNGLLLHIDPEAVCQLDSKQEAVHEQ